MSLREGLRPPRREMPDHDLELLRAYLEGQSRIHFAAWATHDHGADAVDDHVLLGIADADLRSADASALEFGLLIEVPHPHPGWVDLVAMSELEVLRVFADVVWEKNDELSGDLDPLDFRFTWEPIDVPAHAIEAFAERIQIVPGVYRVEISRERLWKNAEVKRDCGQVYVGFTDREPHDFDRVKSALGEAGISAADMAMSAGLPRDERVLTTVLFGR